MLGLKQSPQDSNIEHRTEYVRIMATSYKNLIVYQKAKDLSVEIITYFNVWKLSYSEQILIKQLIRAITSIRNN